jgi:8-oxo-dGTP diphosphatase
MGHIHELYDFTTSAFIVHDERVLLLHHIKIGMWLQPGGHIELDEDPLLALYREIEEETGLTQQDLEIIELVKERRTKNSPNSKLLPIPFDVNVHKFDSTHQHIDLCYLMKSKQSSVRLEADKAHAISWFTLEDMQKLLDSKLLYPDIFELAKLALRHTT